MAPIYLSCRLTMAFEELDGSPQESFPSEWQGVEVTRTFRCKSTARLQLIREFLGYTLIVGDDVYIYRPHIYYLLGVPLTAASVTTKPYGKMGAEVVDDRFADYPYTTFEIKYKTLAAMREIWGGSCSESDTTQVSSEFITLPHEGLYWGTGGGKESITMMDAPAKISHLVEWTYNIRGARVLPAGVFGHPGKVNDGEVVSPSTGFAFATATLLCCGPTVVKEITFSGVVYDVTLRFLYRARGWNYFPRISKAGAAISWERITDGTDPKDFYEEADFDDIIVP